MTTRQTEAVLLVLVVYAWGGTRAASAEKIPEAKPSTGLRAVEVVCVDDQAIGYATFQSHNQKVVSNEHGIFMTHLRTRNQPYTAQTWRLSRSPDGGRTFSTVYEAVHATNPPALETDDEGNI